VLLLCRPLTLRCDGQHLLLVAFDETMDSIYLLSNDTGKITHKDRTCHLSLGTRELFIFDKTGRKAVRVVSLRSVIGSRAFVSNTEHGLSVLEVYDYKYDDSGFFSFLRRTKQRKCETLTFHFAESATCQHWANAISQMSLSHPSSSVEDATRITDFNLTAANRPRRFMVFVNPVSGQGRSVSIWKYEVEPMLLQAGIEVKLVVTQYANHAKDIMEDIDPSSFECILAIGGDGMLFEIVNGLSARSKEDGECVLRSVCVVPIPGGSGNGLAKSLLFEGGEEFSVTNSVFMAVKGTSVSMDLSLVKTTSHTYRSFLLLGWGLISDIDLLSESMRCLGELRLYLAGAYFIMMRRYYKGRLSMFTGGLNGLQSGSPCTLPPLNQTIIAGDGWEVIESSFLFVWIVQTSHVASTMYSGPGVTSDDGVFTIYVVTEMNRLDILRLLIAMDSGDHVKHSKVKTYKCTAYRIEPDHDTSSGGLYTLDGESVEYGPIQGIMQPGAARVKKFILQS
jgi:sphingosine kinase